MAENVGDVDRGRKRHCSKKWQTVLFIIFITACPSLLIPGAIIRARYEKYQNDFLPLNCTIEGSYTEFADNSDRVNFNVNYTHDGNIGYTTVVYESYSNTLDAQIIATHITQYIVNITCYWDSEHGVPVVKIPEQIMFLKRAKSIGLGMVLTGTICFFGTIAIIISEYIMRERRNARARANPNVVNSSPRPNLAGRR